MLEKLNCQDCDGFDKVYSLLEKSFPDDEYRTYDEQKALLADPAYSVYVLYDESRNVKAFISVWDLDEFTFIEHFAVHPEHRNRGIGSAVLNEVLKMFSKTVCLEVEPPETQTAGRRIGFYERNGFCLNEYPYTQPPISRGKKAIPLLIMTSGRKVERAAFERIRERLYARVYKTNKEAFRSRGGQRHAE